MNLEPRYLLAGDVVDIYQREFLALRERLHSAEQENLRRSKELNLVLEEIKKAIAEKQALRDINRTWSSLSGQSTTNMMIRCSDGGKVRR